MATADNAVGVDGLAALRKGLKQIDPALPKQLRDDLVPIAQRIASGAAGRVPSRTGRTAGSIRGGVSGNNAYVQGGRSTVKHYGWLDFGTRSPKPGQARSIGPWKGTGPGPARGRFIYPEIDLQHDEIERAAARAVDDICERVLPR